MDSEGEPRLDGDRHQHRDCWSQPGQRQATSASPDFMAAGAIISESVALKERQEINHLERADT